LTHPLYTDLVITASHTVPASHPVNDLVTHMHLAHDHMYISPDTSLVEELIQLEMGSYHGNPQGWYQCEPFHKW